MNALSSEMRSAGATSPGAPMKVLIVNNLYAPQFVGGAERSVQLLAEALVRAGHQVVIACLARRAGTRRTEVGGVRVHRIGMKNLYWPFGSRQRAAWLKGCWHALDSWNPFMAREVGRILDAERPDVVHTNNLAGFSVSVWRAVKDRRLPLLHTLRDYYLFCPRSTMFRAGQNCGRRCTSCVVLGAPRRKPSDRVDAVVGISRFVLDLHLEHGYFAKTRVRSVVYNGCARKGAASVAHRDRSDVLRVGYLGRLHPSKGVELLLDALARLPRERWQLFVAGTGTPQYEDQLARRGSPANVHRLGFVEPAELFDRIDVLVVPSLWHEPLGRTILESYAHGVPVIAARRGGIPEIVDEGKTGFVFEPETGTELHAVLERFVQSPALAVAMRPEVLRKAAAFAPERMMSSYVDVYRSIAPGHGTAPPPQDG